MKMRTVKRATANGLMELGDDVPLGKVYETIGEPWLAPLYNVEHGLNWECMVVSTVENGEITGFFALELLEPVE